MVRTLFRPLLAVSLVGALACGGKGDSGGQPAAGAGRRWRCPDALSGGKRDRPYDSELKKLLYVASHVMRLVPYDELTLLSPEVPGDEKSIVVERETQMVTAFEGEKLVFSQRCSSGAKGTETPKGEFRTYHKGPAIHMTNQGDALENIYNLPGVPWCSFFTGAGQALHGVYWHNDYGRPRSHGCVNLPSEAAKFIYRCTLPNVPNDADYIHMPGEGTRVQVI